MGLDIFFAGWGAIGRTLLVGIPAYVALIFLLRVSGKRTLSKMNAFDFVVTVALGSTFATILLSRSTSLAEGITAFAFLIIAQAVITWLSVRSSRFQQLIKATPALLYYDGQYLEPALRRERVTHEEIQAAAREAGLGSLEQAQAVVLETDGSITVIDRSGESLRHDLLGNLWT